MNATTDRSRLDDPLMNQLRDTLDAVDSELAARPAMTAPWERIQQGMSRARTRRRRVRLARAGAGQLALAVAVVLVVTGVVSYPSFAPVVAVPGSAGKSALDDGLTRGSLAGDTGWLAALRQHIATSETWKESGGEFWGPPAARKISVIYAGDVGGYRFALVEGDWHWGPIGARQQVWFQGRSGASADVMAQGSNGDPTDLAVTVVSAMTSQEEINSGAVVVLSATARRVVLEPAPTIDAQGRVIRHPQTLTGIDGVYTAAVNTPGETLLSVQGLETTEQVSGARSTPENPPITITGTPARGGAAQPQNTVVQFANDAWAATRQRAASGGSFQLLAAEAPVRPRVDGFLQTLVGRLTLPNGARVLVTGEKRAQDRNMQLDTGRLVAAGDNDANLSIAWRRPARTDNGDPGWTAALGPVGTARVQWIHRDGSISNTAADHTLGATDHDDVTSVYFLDADGNRLGAAAVLDSIDLGSDVVLPELALPAGGK